MEQAHVAVLQENTLNSVRLVPGTTANKKNVRWERRLCISCSCLAAANSATLLYTPGGR